MAQDSGHSGGAVQEVKQADALPAGLLDDAVEAGIDVDAVIERKLDQHDGYNADTVGRFVSTALRKQIEAERGETKKGILVGSRDAYGKQWPRRHSLLQSSGDHLEVATWGGDLPGPGGEDVSIPTGGAMVQLRCEWNEQYENWDGKGIEAVKHTDRSTLVENLSKVAVQPTDLSHRDKETLVAVRGEIRSVTPQTTFEDGEPAGDGEVLMPDARDERQPHFEFTLNPEGGSLVRGHFMRQKYGRLYFQVPDLEQMLEDALELESPDEQADFIEAGLSGLDVILVGNVNDFDSNTTDGGQKRRYFDIAGTALVAVSAETGVDTADTPSESEPDTPSESEPDTPSESEAEPESEPEPEPEPAGDRDLDDVIADIEQYARLTDEDIHDLTVTDIQEQAKGIDDPEITIRAALRRCKEGVGGGDDGTGERGDSSADADAEADADADDSDDPFDAIYDDDTGMLHCPNEGCLAQVSQPDELEPHVLAKHVDVTPDEFDLAEWVQAKVM